MLHIGRISGLLLTRWPLLSRGALRLRPLQRAVSLRLAHESAWLLHLLDRLAVVVDDVALVCQISVEEPAKDHDLVVADGDTSELTPLLVLELAVQVDELPRVQLHVVRLREVDALDSRQARAVVDGTAATNCVDE